MARSLNWLADPAGLARGAAGMKLTCSKCAQAFEADGKAAEAVCPQCGATVVVQVSRLPAAAFAETLHAPRASVPSPLEGEEGAHRR